jgi:hypothetical protein
VATIKASFSRFRNEFTDHGESVANPVGAPLGVDIRRRILRKIEYFDGGDFGPFAVDLYFSSQLLSPTRVGHEGDGGDSSARSERGCREAGRMPLCRRHGRVFVSVGQAS